MLFPPTGPRSIYRALGFRLSQENFERKPWADRRSARPTARRTATRQTARPPDRPTASVKARNIGPRKVGGDDRAVVLTRSGPAHRAPLTKPHTMAPPRPRRDEPANLPAVLRYRQREQRTAEQLIGLRPQHRAHVRARHPHVAVLEHDAQLADPARGGPAGHGDARAALQPAPPRVHHCGKRPRQFNPQLGAIPFLAPPRPRGELTVIVAAPGRIRDGPQGGLALGRLECFVRTGGRESAGRVEVCVNQIAVITEHLPPRGPQGAPHLGRFAPDPGVDLVPHIGIGGETAEVWGALRAT